MGGGNEDRLRTLTIQNASLDLFQRKQYRTGCMLGGGCLHRVHAGRGIPGIHAAVRVPAN